MQTSIIGTPRKTIVFSSSNEVNVNKIINISRVPTSDRHGQLAYSITSSFPTKTLQQQLSYLGFKDIKITFN